MGRSVACTLGIHSWQMVEYDRNRSMAIMQCQKCGNLRQRPSSGSEGDRPTPSGGLSR